MDSKKIVQIVEDYFQKNEVEIVHYKSKFSKQNLFLVNGMKRRYSDMRGLLVEFAVKNNYVQESDLKYYEDQNRLLRQFSYMSKL
jgi:hypothetical protein